MKKRPTFALVTLLLGFIIIFASFNIAEATQYNFIVTVTDEVFDGYGDYINVGDEFWGNFVYTSGSGYEINEWGDRVYSSVGGFMVIKDYALGIRSVTEYITTTGVLYYRFVDYGGIKIGGEFGEFIFVYTRWDRFGIGSMYISNLSPIYDWYSNLYYTGSGNFVPEPATMFLLGSGLIGLAGLRRKFKK